MKELKFGTSGLRDTVENMTDMECYINTRGFLRYLTTIGEFKSGTDVALGGEGAFELRFGNNDCAGERSGSSRRRRGWRAE